MGERIYTAEEAEALAAAATPEPWEINSYGVIMAGDTQVCTDCTYSADERLILAASDLARSVAHHARRVEALEAETARLRAVVSVLQRAGVTGATLPAHIEGGQHAADIARELAAEVVIPDTPPPQPHGWRFTGSRWVARVLPGDVPAALADAASQGLDIDQTRYVVLVVSRRRE